MWASSTCLHQVIPHVRSRHSVGFKPLLQLGGCTCTPWAANIQTLPCVHYYQHPQTCIATFFFERAVLGSEKAGKKRKAGKHQHSSHSRPPGIVSEIMGKKTFSYKIWYLNHLIERREAKSPVASLGQRLTGYSPFSLNKDNAPFLEASLIEKPCSVAQPVLMGHCH